MVGLIVYSRASYFQSSGHWFGLLSSGYFLYGWP